MIFEKVFNVLTTLLVAIGLLWYYYEEQIAPFLVKTLFNNLKSEYRKVALGFMEYYPFVAHFDSKYLVIYEKDHSETVTFKRELCYMLPEEDFIRNTLVDPDITYDEFIKRWNIYKHEDELEGESLESSSSRASKLMGRKYLPEYNKGIDIKVLYNYLNNKIWIDHEKNGRPILPEETIEFAIYNADFKVFMENSVYWQFRDYPLIIICKIKDIFPKEWYSDVCDSIGMEKSRVSGCHHDEGKRKEFYDDFPNNLLQY